MAETASFFSADRSTISRLWRTMSARLADHLTDHADDESAEEDFCLQHGQLPHNGLKGIRGGKRKWDWSALRKEARKVPFSSRRNLRAIGVSVNVPVSALHRMHKEGSFKKHSSSVKPCLSEENKASRFDHALSEIHPVGVGDRCKHKDMMDRVDVDEKWLNQTKINEKCMLVAAGDSDSGEEEPEDEEGPDRKAKHKAKGCIDKVMFICAQARPRWDPDANSMWDGKLGLWPVGHCAPAERRSVSRLPRGTIIWKNETVDKKKCRSLSLEKAFPAVKAKWAKGSMQCH